MLHVADHLVQSALIQLLLCVRLHSVDRISVDHKRLVAVGRWNHLLVLSHQTASSQLNRRSVTVQSPVIKAQLPHTVRLIKPRCCWLVRLR